MQPATIRRLLVFGVCLVAVSCLYLVPSVSGTSSRIGGASTGPHDAGNTPGPAAGDLSIPGHGVSPVADPSSSGMPQPAATTQAVLAPGAGDHDSRVGSTEPSNAVDAEPPLRAAQRLSTGGSKLAATAVDARTDHAPPTVISRLWTTGSDPEQLEVAWTAATDDRGSVWYEVWVNGFNVTTTQQTDAAVGWFNDSSTHVVQIRAVDAAGNKGPWSPTLMVTRPDPSLPLEQADKAPTKAGASSADTPTADPADGDRPKEDNS